MSSIVDSDKLEEKSCFLRKAKVLKILRRAAGEIPSEVKDQRKEGGEVLIRPCRMFIGMNTAVSRVSPHSVSCLFMAGSGCQEIFPTMLVVSYIFKGPEVAASPITRD